MQALRKKETQDETQFTTKNSSLQWGGQKGDEVNNKDESSFQLGEIYTKETPWLKHFVYFNVNFKHVDPMLIITTDNYGEHVFSMFQTRDLDYKSSILGCKHKTAIDDSVWYPM